MTGAPITGLRLTPDGDLTVVTITPGGSSGDTLHALYEALGCQCVDVVQLSAAIDMWVDDEGLMRQPLSPYATIIARHFGLIHQPYAGTVLFLGGVVSGDSQSLTPAAGSLIRAVLDEGTQP